MRTFPGTGKPAHGSKVRWLTGTLTAEGRAPPTQSTYRSLADVSSPRLSFLELTYRDRCLCNIYGIVQSKNLQPGAVSLGLDLQGGLKRSLLQDRHALLRAGVWRQGFRDLRSRGAIRHRNCTLSDRGSAREGDEDSV